VKIMVGKMSLEGIAGLRVKLARGRPKFAAAVGKELQAEGFCQGIRAQLRTRRERLGLDQVAIATKLEIGQPSVSRIENGSGDIGLKTLFRYADAIGLKPVVLFVPSEARIAQQLTQRADLTRPLKDQALVAGAVQQAHETILRAMSDNMSDTLPEFAVKLKESTDASV
jgi:transcriptional regulator with XRE-family HTH domain